jgi:hypothetical protein
MELVVAKEVVEEAVIAPTEDAAGAVVYLVKVRAIDLLAKVLAFAEVGKWQAEAGTFVYVDILKTWKMMLIEEMRAIERRVSGSSTHTSIMWIYSDADDVMNFNELQSWGPILKQYVCNYVVSYHR